ncbi:oligosaccharide flippase family protein [Metabacillus sp. KIGAM252]|uniref:Oligosaccharide flippase family protein n=1 Tax=Metabacillus flavus TaxID=2823519 RepID=A0ABS5LJH2_9BACI|nr:oligosaccharide flippase family protein [Metabacillus flavus]MBS2970703.1 oligosaccharide flippase family protein [Metabacillus flavus]
MLKQLKRFGGDSLLYALMNVGTKLIAFLMLPIYTSFLGDTEYGVFENIDSITNLMTFLVIFGTDSALAFYFFEKKHAGRKMDYVRNVLLFRFAVAFILYLLSVVLGSQVSMLVAQAPGYEKTVQLAFIVLLLEALITLVLTYFRFEFLTWRVVIATVARLGMVALFSYLFLKYWEQEVDMIMFGRIAAASIIIVFLLPHFKNLITFKFDKKLMKEILIYAAPLVPASLSFWLIASANRLILTAFDGPGAAGLFGAAVKFATVITLLTSGVQMAWRPYSMSIKDKPDAKKLFGSVYVLIFAIGMFGLMGIATFIPAIFKLMVQNKVFHPASVYVPLLSLGTFLNFYYLIISVGLFIKKETKPISIQFGIAAIISLILNVVLIPAMGLWGAALAITLSYGYACAAIFIRSQKTYHVPTPVGKLIFMFITSILSIAAVQYILDFSDLSVWLVLVPWAFFLLTNGGVLLTLRKKGRTEEAA